MQGWAGTSQEEEEKEQSSPVSVLDCPFQDDDDDDDDEEEETSSPFHSSFARIEERKQKLMHKIRRFESLAGLEPVDLAKRIESPETTDDVESLGTPASPCSTTIDISESEEYEEDEATELLKLVKSNTSSCGSKVVDSMLLDLFRGGGGENGGRDELVKEAEDWMNGRQELYLGWEVRDCRKLYLKDMERNGVWRNSEEEHTHKQEVCLELELQIFSDLVTELLLA